MESAAIKDAPAPKAKKKAKKSKSGAEKADKS
jgi:hypothetical protein